MKKVISIIGDPKIGAIALAEEIHNYHAPLVHALDGVFDEPTEQRVFELARIPIFKEPWIDPNEQVHNHKKHNETCAKNRKKRKNKRRG